MLHFMLTNCGTYLEETTRLEVVPSAIYRFRWLQQMETEMVSKHKDEDLLVQLGCDVAMYMYNLKCLWYWMRPVLIIRIVMET